MKPDSTNTLADTNPFSECPQNTSHVPTNSSEWMTTEEAACYLRCAVKTVYNHKCNGCIKGYNSGGKAKGKLLFKKSDLDAFIVGKNRG